MPSSFFALSNVSIVFVKLFNRSIAAGWMILAVVLLRLALKKAPRWIICLLWGLVALKLVCPFSVESVFSLVPSMEIMSISDMYSEEPAGNSYFYQLPNAGEMWDKDGTVAGQPSADQKANGWTAGSQTADGWAVGGQAADDRTADQNPAEGNSPMNTDAKNQTMRGVILIGTVIWLAGGCFMVSCALVSFRRLRKTVRESVLLQGNVYICDEISTPFILGILYPRIYLPSGMEEETMRCVITHENIHLKRHDHWWKPLGYLLLAVYWFHPLIWLAYVLFGRDIEFACDERAVQNMGRVEKTAYAQALLDCSLPRRLVTACPLAFGEVGVKERVKKVLHYRKPVFWISAAAVMTCVAVAVCFLTNPKEPVFAHNDGGMNGSGQDAASGSVNGNVKESQQDSLRATTENGRENAPGQGAGSGGPTEGAGFTVRDLDEEITAETLFAWMQGTFRFWSGTGDWSTELYLNEDGSFTGIQSDHDGPEFPGAVDPEKFPQGTIYLCEFKGAFSEPEKVGDSVYSVHVQSLEYDVPGKETIEDGMRYVTVDSNSIGNGDEILIYLPGYPVSNLSWDVFDWIMIAKEYWEGIGPSELPFCVLNNVDENTAFYSDNRYTVSTKGEMDSQQEITAENLFARMPEVYQFLSGAGGWRTELYLNEDGSFTGLFIDGELGSADPEKYPQGTTYRCEFTGSFTEPKKVGEYVYSVHVQSLEYDAPGTEAIEDGMRYITAEPYGLDDVDEILIYLPGYPVSELPEAFYSWILSARQYYQGNGPENLPFYVLGNVNGEEAFFSKPGSARRDTD